MFQSFIYRLFLSSNRVLYAAVSDGKIKGMVLNYRRNSQTVPEYDMSESERLSCYRVMQPLISKQSAAIAQFVSPHGALENLPYFRKV